MPAKKPSDTQNQLMKHNDIIRASYKLNLSEIRLLALVVREIKPSNLYYEIHASEYSEAFNVDMDTAYTALIESSENLFDRRFTAYLSDRKRLMRWVQTIDYFPDKGKVGVKIGEDFISFLMQLKKNFTVLDFDELSKLKSAYAVRVFEILKSFQYKEKVILSLEDIRTYFDLNKDYSQNNIQEKIIKPSLSQINELTSLDVRYEPVKEGRKIVGYIFYIKTKKIKRVMKDAKKIVPPVWSSLADQLLKECKKKQPDLTKSDILNMSEREGRDVIYILEMIKKAGNDTDDFKLEPQ